MQKHRTGILFAMISASVLALSGCSTAATESQEASTATATTTVQATSSEADVTYVQVQSMDDDTITALVGTMNQPTDMPSSNAQSGESGSAPQETPPEQQSGDSTQQGTPPEMPSGDAQQGGTGCGRLWLHRK